MFSIEFNLFGSMKAGGNESSYLAREQDSGGDRQYWHCLQCPLADSCPKSKASFKKANLFSFESEQKCREYVVLHLRHAGVHADDALSEEDAVRYAEMAQVEAGIETYQDREEYRNALERRGTKRKAASPPTDDEPLLRPTSKAGTVTPKIPDHPPPGAPIAELTTAVSQLTQVLTSSSGSALPATSSGSAVPSLSIRNTSALSLLQVGAGAHPDQGINLLRDSLSRILESLSQATSQCITTARLLNEEGTRLRAASSAIEEQLRHRFGQ